MSYLKRKPNRASETRNGIYQNKINRRPDYIKQNLKPIDFYRHELPGAKFKRPGWNNGGLCPFHSDTRQGSFHVSLETGGYKCFACGAAGGDIIAFTMNRYGLSFTDSLEKLANDWGLT
ncbi:CHC2 zinc finger domain-containing protein [Methylicorpusculum oleiharenae]|uniref:CHC2 zinc finger domain-containing protein n=1 Tax=Methylicorpusculum oleiharenae TaxID=1338687 RepID=UPI001E35FB91|nr:CHC2 zinc finger domain-containing protein [Methylicorpusculum oleiharenae]MCD2452261.1 CHC2 zinc finger domain-containing protein [Methylicorpusculum oleiharenae]